MGGPMSQMGQSKSKIELEPNTGVTFDDVAGAEGSKLELTEVVDFLKDPTKYSKLGANIPKGVIMEGPPGTGKTLLARAVAGEAGVPFISSSASELVLHEFVTFSARQKRIRHASSSLTRLMLSAASEQEVVVVVWAVAAMMSASRRSIRSSQRWTASRATRASLSSPPPIVQTSLTAHWSVQVVLIVASQLTFQTSKDAWRS